MAPATFTLRATYHKPNGEPQTQTRPVHIFLTGTKVVKDTEGNVILSGRVEADVVDGVLTVPNLPDPRDPGYNPSGFGFTVSAVFRDNHPPAVSFGAEALDAHLGVDGVLELEDVTPVDPSTFSPTATYADAADVNALEGRVTTLETTPTVTSYNDLTDTPSLATVATTGAYADLTGQPAIPDDPDVAAWINDEQSQTRGALSATIAGAVDPKADRPAAVTGASPLRAGRVHVGRAVQITKGTNYSAFPGLTQTATGRLVMAYRSASGHLTTDGKIVVRYSDDRGATWTAEATAVPNAAGSDKRDPALSVTSLGLTMTFFTWNGSNPTGAYYATSADEGVTWSAPVALPSQTGADGVTAPMIELTNGDLLVPIYGNPGTGYEAHAILSTDGGGSWSGVPLATGGDHQEPYVQQLQDGTLLALIRDPSNGGAVESRSTDNGQTWSAPTLAYAAGPSRNAFSQTADGTIVAFCETDGSVTRLAARVSYDNGATWGQPTVLVTSAGGGAYAQSVEVSPGVLAVIAASDAHVTKADVSFRYVTVGPRVTPLGDANSLRLPQAQLAFPTGLLAFDTFDRADEALDYSVSDSGHVWRRASGPTGGVSIVGREVKHTGPDWNPNAYMVEVGTANVDLSVAYTSNQANVAAVWFRYGDLSNNLLVKHTATDTWKLQKADAGVTTDLATATLTTANNVWQHVRVAARGNRVRVFLDGEKIIDHTLSAADNAKYAAFTMHGIWTYHNSVRMRAFSVAN